MLKLFQLLPVAPALAAVLLVAVYQLLRLSLHASVQPRVSARTRVQNFISAAAYVALLLAAALIVFAALPER